MLRDYVFMTDSDSDLPWQFAQEKNIPVVQMPYNIDNQEYFDDNGSRESVDTYTYGTEGDYLTALSETFDPEVEEQMPAHMWVDKHGFIFFDEHPSDYKFTYDTQGNWLNYIFNEGKVTVKRTITYN